MAVKMARGTAKIISNILHPYVFLSVVVAIIAYQQSPSLWVWVKWTGITLLSAYLIPIIYIRVKVALAVHTSGAQVNVRSFFREKPNEMLILACLFGLPSATVLYFLGYPSDIMATLVGVAAVALLIALVNRVYRASFHLALFTAAVFPLVIVFGSFSLVILPFILLLGASRYYLGEHTLWQLATGFLLGLVVAGAVFRAFGILGWAG
jgi:hypothetical protein